MRSQRVGCENLREERWLRLQMITYKDPENKTRKWEMVERTTRRGDVDAVAIFPILRKAGEPDRTIVIAQYRPPLDKETLELPAGLIDEGETPLEAAMRELKEETGFVADEAGAEETPIMYNDPGITNANMKMVILNVDMDRPENMAPAPANHLGEFITTMVLPLEGLYSQLQAMEREKGYAIDARLFSMVFGFEYAKRFHN